jgi:hypothetical protein
VKSFSTSYPRRMRYGTIFFTTVSVSLIFVIGLICQLYFLEHDFGAGPNTESYYPATHTRNSAFSPLNLSIYSTAVSLRAAASIIYVDHNET